MRNAVYHGLEDEAERLDAGKSRRGRLTLSARARGRTVRLSVADDGRGLDPDALRRRAVELGMMAAEHAEALDDAAARELIYQPGLSTAAEVSTGAGRGVGMDAVRHAVGRLGGEVRVESASGRGTRFVLDLPASLRVTEALTLRVGEQVFGLPLAGVRRLVHVVDERVTTDGTRRWLRAGGVDLPLISVAERLGIEASGPSRPLPGLRGTAVVVAPTGRPAALWVDDVLGIDEVVIRSLGEFLGAIEPFAGVTLDAEGAAMLLVDALSLLEDRGESLAVPAPPTTAQPPEPATGRVLLVDDSPSVRQVLGRALRSAGFDVVAATDGVEATARWFEAPVDALVTDLEMPRRDGEVLIGEIRRLSAGRPVPIVVLSTLADADRLAALGVDAWFAKPVTEAALVDRLRELIGAVRGDA
ncbi:MAG: response regulator [Acidobacteriota bacterium]